VLKYIQPGIVAGIAALPPPKQKYGFCAASGCSVFLRVRGEWPLPKFASDGSVAIPAADPKKLSGCCQS